MRGRWNRLKGLTPPFDRGEYYPVTALSSSTSASGPAAPIAVIGDGLSLTSRSVYSIVGDLRRAGMVNVRKEGRRHHYSINYDAIVGQSVVSEGGELRHVLRFLVNRTLAVLDEDEDPHNHRPSRAPAAPQKPRS